MNNAKKAAATTAEKLLADLAPFGPRVDGFDLVFDSDPDDELFAQAEILQTGLRSILTGWRWYGLDRTGLAHELSPVSPIPIGMGLLCVEGDPSWDRLPRTARKEHPELFEGGAR